MGKFQPGESGNPGGRPQGSKNLLPTELRQRLSAFLDGEITEDKLREFLKELEPKDRFTALLNLLNFVLPKLRSVENTYDIDTMPEEELERLYQKIAAKRKSNIDLTRLSKAEREQWYTLLDKATISKSE